MRWPWQQRRDVDAAPVVARVPAEPPPTRAGWAFLPPLVGAPPAAPTALRADFLSRLPTRTVPLQLTTLGHLVSEHAPAALLGDAHLPLTPRSPFDTPTLSAAASASAPTAQRTPAAAARATSPGPPSAAPVTGASTDAGSAHTESMDAPSQHAPTMDAAAPAVNPPAVDPAGAGPIPAEMPIVSRSGSSSPVETTTPHAATPASSPPRAPAPIPVGLPVSRLPLDDAMPVRSSRPADPPVTGPQTYATHAFEPAAAQAAEPLPGLAADTEPPPETVRTLAGLPPLAAGAPASDHADPPVSVEDAPSGPVGRPESLTLARTIDPPSLPFRAPAEAAANPGRVHECPAVDGRHVAQRRTLGADADVPTPPRTPLGLGVPLRPGERWSPPSDPRRSSAETVNPGAEPVVAQRLADSRGDLPPAASIGASAAPAPEGADPGDSSVADAADPAPVPAPTTSAADAAPERAAATPPIETPSGTADTTAGRGEEFDDPNGEGAGAAPPARERVVPLILARRIDPAIATARPTAAPVAVARVLPGDAGDRPASAGARTSTMKAPRDTPQGDRAIVQRVPSTPAASSVAPPASAAGTSAPIELTSPIGSSMAPFSAGRADEVAPAFHDSAPLPLPVERHADSVLGTPAIDRGRLERVQRVLARNAIVPPADDAGGRPDVRVQTQTLDQAEAPETSSDPGISVQTEASAPPADAPAPAGQGRTPGLPEATSPVQVDALLDRLYAPLVRRLRAEMVIDRERRGVRIDRI